MSDQVKYLLDEIQIPRDWYNIVADLPRPPDPVLHPGTLKPVGPQDLEPLFPMALIQQEVATERTIEIPEPVRDVYRQWRPSPLYRARRWEQALDTPAKIYYKYEGVSPAGSHKPNTAVAQAFYNKEAGVRRLTTETGAGQWGSALAFAGALFGLEVRVYMVRVSFEQKPYRKALMEAWGAECVASPSTETNAGRRIERPFQPTRSIKRGRPPLTIDFADRFRDLDRACGGNFLLNQRHWKKWLEILRPHRLQRPRVQHRLGRARQVGYDIVPVPWKPGFLEQIFDRIGHSFSPRLAVCGRLPDPALLH